MLTDQQLTETALRIVDRELTVLGQFDRGEDIRHALHLHHCDSADHNTWDCPRDDWGRESRGVQAAIKSAVEDLRDRLATIAYDHGVELRADA